MSFSFLGLRHRRTGQTDAQLHLRLIVMRHVHTLQRNRAIRMKGQPKKEIKGMNYLKTKE